MTLTDPVAAGLDRRFEACCRSQAARRALARWQHEPALSGLSLIDIRRRLTTARPDHNPVVAAMLRAHQDGDGDATTVLLAAFIPYVCSDPNAPRITAERIADGWAALGHLLATADPDEAERPGETRAFLYVLVGRMRRNAQRLRDVDRPTPGVAPVDGTRLDDGLPTSAHLVEDRALARLELAAIGSHVQAGTIKPAQWHRLIEYRLHGANDRSRRGALDYTTRRLAALVGRRA